MVEGSRESASLLQCGHVIRESVAAQRRVRWRQGVSPLWSGLVPRLKDRTVRTVAALSRRTPMRTEV